LAGGDERIIVGLHERFVNGAPLLRERDIAERTVMIARHRAASEARAVEARAAPCNHAPPPVLR